MKRFSLAPKRLMPPIVTAATIVLALVLSVRADPIDDAVIAQMAKRKIPGLSLAVVDRGAIVKAQGYGAIDLVGGAAITAETLFQAGSISKPVTALGALLLVEGGKLSLDADINDSLTTWKVPENDLTRQEKVTLRRVLSHSAGLTVHGFPGYDVGVPRPTLPEVLDGKKPANTAAIRVDLLPGSKWRYSGGGYTVLQQAMIDVTGVDFPTYMHRAVLAPLGMTHSTFEQPLPSARAGETATGHYPTGGRAVAGRWHIYPEMAAAGLWTTPSDLARFVMAVQHADAGRDRAILSRDLMRQMLTRQKDNFGLGFALASRGAAERFAHNGRDEGFDATLVAYRNDAQGAVVMINANDNTGVLPRVLEAIADAYQWRDYPKIKPAMAIEDKEPAVTAQLQAIFQQAAKGEWDRNLYSTEMAEVLAKAFSGESKTRQELHSYGDLKSIELLNRTTENERRVYRYRLTYEKETVSVQCAYDQDGKISGLRFQPE
jgi:CubicO group peptidase (beta-lactamase class C family)